MNTIPGLVGGQTSLSAINDGLVGSDIEPLAKSADRTASKGGPNAESFENEEKTSDFFNQFALIAFGPVISARVGNFGSLALLPPAKGEEALCCDRAFVLIELVVSELDAGVVNGAV